MSETLSVFFLMVHILIIVTIFHLLPPCLPHLPPRSCSSTSCRDAKEGRGFCCCLVAITFLLRSALVSFSPSSSPPSSSFSFIPSAALTSDSALFLTTPTRRGEDDCAIKKCSASMPRHVCCCLVLSLGARHTSRLHRIGVVTVSR